MSISKKYSLSKPFQFFEELSLIPHGSGNMVGISNYCKDFAEERGLKVIQDEDLNLLIFKPATPGYEDVDTLILQGHMDMVCEKTADSNFDFEKDGLELESDGVNIWAKNTTLGADNGIAIAMGLAIMDDNSIEHGPLEFIFTVDEENGLNGAKSIDLTPLKGRKLINLDSEEDYMILTSCAGGAVVQGNVEMVLEEARGISYSLVLEGLKGGHSGMEIHKELGNSNILMGRILDFINQNIDLKIIGLAGGKLDNVITSRTESKLLVNSSEEECFVNSVKEIELLLQNELELGAPDLKIVLTKLSEKSEVVIDEKSKITVLNALMNLPNGVQHMSLGIEGMVETSLNLGVMELSGTNFKFEFSIRSSKETAKQHLVRRVVVFTEYLGGIAQVLGGYPGWEYRVDSPLRDMVAKVYEECFDIKPEIGAIHAGLECGLLSDKIENLDCISIGPNLKDVHSVNEIMEIASVEKIWKLVLGVLKNK